MVVWYWAALSGFRGSRADRSRRRRHGQPCVIPTWRLPLEPFARLCGELALGWRSKNWDSCSGFVRDNYKILTSSPRVALGRGLGDDVVHARPAPQAEHLLELDLLLRGVVERDRVRAALAAASTFNSLHEEVVSTTCFDALEERAVIVTAAAIASSVAFFGAFLVCYRPLACYFYCETCHTAAICAPGSKQERVLSQTQQHV